MEMAMAMNAAPQTIHPEVLAPLERSPDEWAAYCTAARARAAASLIEWGRRIDEAHTAYKAQPQRWGRTWEDWCETTLGVRSSYANKLRAIARNFGSGTTDFLPASFDSLYALARLKQAAPDAFDSAVADGTVRVDMERRAAIGLLKAHTGPRARMARLAADIPIPDAGTYWRLGQHLLFCGDSSTAGWAPLDGEAALAVCDPPYGFGVDTWDSAFVWSHDWLEDVARVVCVFPGLLNLHVWPSLTRMSYRWALSYQLTNGMQGGPTGFANWRIAMLYSRHQSIHRGVPDCSRGAVDPSENRGHRGQKPSALIRWLVELFSTAGDIVIDPFLGSGTTLLVCEELGRVCVGAELDPNTCRNIIAAWQQQTGRVAEPVA